jgi:hypothetical protein
MTGQMLFQTREWQLRSWAGATESGAKNEQVSGREGKSERAKLSIGDRMRYALTKRRWSCMGTYHFDGVG